MPSQSPAIETASPTESTVASDYRFICAETFNDARAQCLDNPPCPNGNGCEDGYNCWPIHCTDCPELPCIGDYHTSSPTNPLTSVPPSDSPTLSGSPTTNAPTAIDTYYERLPPKNRTNAASGGWNCAWFVGVLLASIDVLLLV
mmetsp:Transcript_21652/g.47066  ORF Transcript_21652/g.47066 Transcript_21652/m.47066 type:complete len:144 (-) Transcript_21652:1250-1681(-)